MSKPDHAPEVQSQEVHCDIPANRYPFTVEALNPITGAVVWSETVEAPSRGEHRRVHIPPLAKQLGHPVNIRIKWGDGSVTEVPTKTYHA